MSAIPVLLGVGALLVAGLAAAKKKQPSKDEEAERVYRQAMSPDMSDTGWMRQAVTFLRSVGQNEKANAVAGRIASLDATAAADAAARAALPRARQEYEDRMGGPPTAAQLDNVWARVQSGQLDEPTLMYAWTLFETYGTPARAAATMAQIERLRSGSAPPPPVVVVDERNGGGVVVSPPPADTQPPAPPPPRPTPAEPPEPPFPQPPRPTPAEPPEPPVYQPPQPEEPPDLADEEEAPPVDTFGTIALARDMISAEGRSDWKTALQPAIKTWQSRVGLTIDGKFGPKGAYRMAEEVGILPRIRYWPKGSVLPGILTQYRDQLYSIAADLERQDKREHAAALRVSAEAEKAQGYPKAPKAVPTSEREAEAATVITAIQAATGPQTLDELAVRYPWLMV